MNKKEIICNCIDKCEKEYPNFFKLCIHSKPHTSEGKTCNYIACNLVPREWEAICCEPNREWDE